MQTKLRQYGVVGLSKRLVQRCFEVICRVKIKREYCYACTLAEFEAIPAGERLFRQLSLQDFEAQRSLPSPESQARFTDERMQKIRSAFETRRHCAYGHFDGDILTCYGWINSAGFRFGHIEMPADGVYIWDTFTHPSYRGRGLQRRLLQELLSIAEEQGKRGALICVSDFNTASRKNIERTGFRPVARCTNIIRSGRTRFSAFRYLK